MRLPLTAQVSVSPSPSKQPPRPVPALSPQFPPAALALHILVRFSHWKAVPAGSARVLFVFPQGLAQCQARSGHPVSILGLNNMNVSEAKVNSFKWR